MEERRLLIAVAASLVLLTGYSYLYPPKQAPRPEAAASPAPATTSPAAPVAVAATPATSPTVPVPTPVADEREPTLEQIQAMVFEAEHVAMVGANRAAMLIGWAALEATLRRLAQQEGRQGKVGVQPHILLRDLFASGRLNPEEHRTLEVLRQKRMAAAHGLAPAEMDAELIPGLIEINYRLLEAVHEGALTAASDSTPPSP